MKGILFTVLVIATVISAWDHRLTSDCLNGIQDAESCCKDIPDAWLAHLKNPDDCNSYFQCVNGAPELMPCPEDLHWSVENDLCQFKDVAQCNVNAL